MRTGVARHPASRWKGPLIGLAGYGTLLIFSQVVLPGTDDRGTPAAILFQGLALGLVSALVAAGILLIYRTSRIINFAQAAIGGAGGAFTYHLMAADTTQWPFLPAFVVGVVLSGVIGAVVELGFVRRFFNAPRLVVTVLTIALLPGLGFASSFVQNLPIFGDVAERTLGEQLGTEEVALPFESFTFTIGRLGIPFGFPHLFAIAISVLGLIGLGLFLRYTRAGIAVRASSENQDRAMLLGINVKGLSTLIWAVAGLISGISVIATGLNTSVGTLAGGVGGPANDVLLVAMAAAVLAKMRSIPIVVASTLAFEVIKESIRYSFEEHSGLFNLFLFVVILVGLLVQRRDLQRSEETDTSSWEANQEFRSTPKEMLEIPGIRIWRGILIGLAIIAVLIYPWATPTGATNLGGFVAIVGIGMISLVVLTGWAGQVSLGQFALIGIGAVVGAGLTTRMGISFWLAIPLSMAVTSAIAVAVGLPALRIKGLFLAVTTFALAFAVQSNLFNANYFSWLLPKSVERPTLFLFDFDDERSMYYLALISLLICVLVVTILRRSRTGRVLIGLRENEANIQSFGVPLIRTRLMAFALSGALCGFAGILLAHHQRAITPATYAAQESLTLFIFTVIGGIGSVSGAIFGAVYYALNILFGSNILLSLIVGPVGLLVLLYMAPGGISSIAFGLRDGLYRIIAQRRRMVVPSLFADVDPSAMEQQLAPLGEAPANTGLQALGLHRRYRGESALYGSRGRLVKDGRRKRADETSFLRVAEGTESLGTGAAYESEVAGDQSEKVT